MKIALVKRKYSLRSGGSERYCVNLARNLTRRGHAVTVIGQHIDDDLHGEVHFEKVRVNRLTSSTRNRSFAENAGAAALGGNHDIVYGLGRAYGLDAVRVTERLQSHWVKVHYQRPLRQFWEQRNPRQRTLINLEQQIYQSQNVRRIVTQSQLDRTLLERYYSIPSEKIRTIYNGVDTDTFHPDVRHAATEVRAEWHLSHDQPLLVFASMDFEGKGLRSIIEALSQSRDTDSRLLVLGQGPIRRFQRIADAWGVGHRVLFGGRRSDIQRYYGAADLFLLPTVYEPFPNVNLEAMACGLPPLTTQTAGGADIIRHGENGYLIPASDSVEAMRKCIDEHLSLDSNRRQEISQACWDTARQMTIDRNVEQTLSVFREVMDERL
ncbi:MAG: glycosyltransferase family 4 protein [Planctomycetaceae bacterium]